MEEKWDSGKWLLIEKQCIWVKYTDTLASGDLTEKARLSPQLLTYYRSFQIHNFPQVILTAGTKCIQIETPCLLLNLFPSNSAKNNLVFQGSRPGKKKNTSKTVK